MEDCLHGILSEPRRTTAEDRGPARTRAAAAAAGPAGMGHAPWRRDPHAAPAPTPTPRARARHLIPRAARHISRARKASSWLACSLLCPLVWRHRPLTTCGCTSSQFGALWLAALGARRFRPPQTSCVSIPLAVTSGEELHCLLIVLVGGRSVKEEHGDVGTGDLHCGVVEALV
jgi:hypothetical protein